MTENQKRRLMEFHSMVTELEAGAKEEACLPDRDKNEVMLHVVQAHMPFLRRKQEDARSLLINGSSITEENFEEYIAAWNKTRHRRRENSSGLSHALIEQSIRAITATVITKSSWFKTMVDKTEW